MGVLCSGSSGNMVYALASVSEVHLVRQHIKAGRLALSDRDALGRCAAAAGGLAALVAVPRLGARTRPTTVLAAAAAVVTPVLCGVGCSGSALIA